MRRVIPAGLRKCGQCGEYKGRGIVPSYRYDLLEIVLVRCLCEGIVCHHCRKNAIHRPISNYYVEATGPVLHVPYFGCISPCQECWERANEQLKPSSLSMITDRRRMAPTVGGWHEAHSPRKERCRSSTVLVFRPG